MGTQSLCFSVPRKRSAIIGVGFCGTSDQGAGPLNTGPVCNVVIEHFDEHKRQDLRYVPVAFDIEHGIAFAIDVSEDIQ